MSTKKWLFYPLILTLLFMTGCAHAAPSEHTTSVHSKTNTSRVAANKQFTLNELSKFDGRNGHPAYIAVKGKVYDVTHAPDWHNGSHHGVQAGQDLTSAIEHAPHGTAVLSAVPIVGNLVKGTKSSEAKSTNSKANNKGHQTAKSKTKRTFTLAELKKYNGQNGGPAYVAVHGKVYDVTHAPGWHNGWHHGVQAGQDLTTAIEHAPHGTSVLSQLTVIGYVK
ncbi:cytochrome b5 domain-containing protein [Sporolactobacillus kofuensis]|uniref:Cytochrome b5 domain-containing protein n=1 Tax=Sporolactobacillus kofuensis TaxID=269672 RepID=A0ABW1WFA8_9BACL|nr:cytochrome b5 domain-containing protein [Sporolactobacillus kofuensis]MCO7174975.1 hypothetical protein [Sporolactobacillus kofuensis]